MPDQRLDRTDLARLSVRGVIVVLLVTITQNLVVFGTQVILARILLPEVFGAFAFAVTIAMLFRSLADWQADKYLIREKGEVFRKADCAFTLELLIAAVVFVVLLVLAPPLMEILDRSELTEQVQALAFLVFCNPLFVPRGLAEKEFKFFRARWPTVAGQLAGGVVGILMALEGLGIWSLVFWRLTTRAAEAAVLWKMVSYRPRLRWDREIISSVFEFGWPLMGSATLVFFYWNVDYYLVERVLGPEQLGFYWLAFELSHYLLQVRGAVVSVFYPAFSSLDSVEDLRESFGLISSATTMFYLWPTVIVLLFGEELIELVYGETWLPATTTLKVLMVLTLVRAVASYYPPILMTVGRTRVILAVTIYAALAVTILVYVLAQRFGIVGAAVGVLVANTVGNGIMGWYVQSRVVSLPYQDLMRVLVLGLVVLGVGLVLKSTAALPSVVIFVVVIVFCAGLSWAELRRWRAMAEAMGWKRVSN